MSEFVVDRLEMVDIRDDHAAASPPPRFKATFQAAPVENAGERIGITLVPQFPHQVRCGDGENEKSDDRASKSPEYLDNLPEARPGEIGRAHDVARKIERKDRLSVELHGKQDKSDKEDPLYQASMHERARLNAENEDKTAKHQIDRERDLTVGRSGRDEIGHRAEEAKPYDDDRQTGIAFAHALHHAFAEQDHTQKMT